MDLWRSRRLSWSNIYKAVSKYHSVIFLSLWYIRSSIHTSKEFALSIVSASDISSETPAMKFMFFTLAMLIIMTISSERIFGGFYDNVKHDLFSCASVPERYRREQWWRCPYSGLHKPGVLPLGLQQLDGGLSLRWVAWSLAMQMRSCMRW